MRLMALPWPGAWRSQGSCSRTMGRNRGRCSPSRWCRPRSGCKISCAQAVGLHDAPLNTLGQRTSCPLRPSASGACFREAPVGRCERPVPLMSNSDGSQNGLRYRCGLRSARANRACWTPGFPALRRISCFVAESIARTTFLFTHMVKTANPLLP